jgi:16S rRNA G966 N2-methylase RsmD
MWNDYYFPKLNKKYSRHRKSIFKLDNIGKYSITLPNEAEQITSIIKKNIDKLDIIITDVMAGVGGNTISFAKNFDSVNAIELDKKRYEYLKNNIAVYRTGNVDYYNCDFLTIIERLIQDVVFLDPPWGGKDYKYVKKLKLKISGQEVENICNNMINKKIAQLIVLKLPTNYDMVYFKSKINRDMVIYKMKKMIIVCVKLNYQGLETESTSVESVESNSMYDDCLFVD